METKEVRLNKLVFMILFNSILDLYELLDALRASKAAHVLFQISVSTLLLSKSRTLIISQYPREDEILVQVAVASSA
jgi:hypothetical protein